MTGGGVPRPAPANKTALAARVRNAARSADLPEGRVQRQLGVLVVSELLGRVRNENGQQLFLVKGGSSIELRLGVASSRTTKDLGVPLSVVDDRLPQMMMKSGWTSTFLWLPTSQLLDTVGCDRECEEQCEEHGNTHAWHR